MIRLRAVAVLLLGLILVQDYLSTNVVEGCLGGGGGGGTSPSGGSSSTNDNQEEDIMSASVPNLYEFDPSGDISTIPECRPGNPYRNCMIVKLNPAAINAPKIRFTTFNGNEYVIDKKPGSDQRVGSSKAVTYENWEPTYRYITMSWRGSDADPKATVSIHPPSETEDAVLNVSYCGERNGKSCHFITETPYTALNKPEN